MSHIELMEYLSVDALHTRPERFWKYFAQVFGPPLDAQPNAGHKALAELERAGYVHTIITQNIDSLHQKPEPKVYWKYMGIAYSSLPQLRSHLSYAEALAQLSKYRYRCEKCGHDVRPDVVLFGDMMPVAFNQAVQAVEKQ